MRSFAMRGPRLSTRRIWDARNLDFVEWIKQRYRQSLGGAFVDLRHLRFLRHSVSVPQSILDSHELIVRLSLWIPPWDSSKVPGARTLSVGMRQVPLSAADIPRRSGATDGRFQRSRPSVARRAQERIRNELGLTPDLTTGLQGPLAILSAAPITRFGFGAAQDGPQTMPASLAIQSHHIRPLFGQGASQSSGQFFSGHLHPPRFAVSYRSLSSASARPSFYPAIAQSVDLPLGITRPPSRNIPVTPSPRTTALRGRTPFDLITRRAKGADDWRSTTSSAPQWKLHAPLDSTRILQSLSSFRSEIERIAPRVAMNLSDASRDMTREPLERPVPFPFSATTGANGPESESTQSVRPSTQRIAFHPLPRPIERVRWEPSPNESGVAPGISAERDLSSATSVKDWTATLAGTADIVSSHSAQHPYPRMTRPPSVPFAQGRILFPDADAHSQLVVERSAIPRVVGRLPHATGSMTMTTSPRSMVPGTDAPALYQRTLSETPNALRAYLQKRKTTSLRESDEDDSSSQTGAVYSPLLRVSPSERESVILEDSALTRQRNHSIGQENTWHGSLRDLHFSSAVRNLEVARSPGGDVRLMTPNIRSAIEREIQAIAARQIHSAMQNAKAARSLDGEVSVSLKSPSKRALTERDIPALTTQIYGLLRDQIKREKRMRGL
jgi:hypothetical protein